MESQKLIYPIHEVSSYINWIYFFHAFGFAPKFSQIADIHGCDACRALWLASFPQEERSKATEAMQLYKEAQRMINLLDSSYQVYGLFRLCSAIADGNDIIADGIRIPLLRQQQVKQQGKPYLCLSDYIAPRWIEGNTISNTIGIFATTVDERMEKLYEDDPYKHMLTQVLCDRLAEACAEKMHEDIRRTYWGYAPDEQLNMKQLHQEEFQGIRPAVGYPSLPDQSINFVLDELIDYNKIRIRLTENGAMQPHATVCGLMFGHPDAQYFNIHKIGEDQLKDYARRRGKSIEEIQKFLIANL